MSLLRMIKYISCLAIILLLTNYYAFAQSLNKYNAIYSGTPWFDDQGNIVSAHAANIIKDKGRYYLFGEKHLDNSNAFAGFNCYSSTDLYNWKFESMALSVQDTGRLGPNRVGERVKVMKCPKTGEYVMFMHTDDMAYKDQYIGYATAKTVTGPYTFRGILLFNGKPIRKWDMGVFQDTNGSGYLLVHGGEIYKLSDDYQSVSEQVIKDISPECESPAIFKKGGIYFWLCSHRTSWERNDNYYYTATSLKGPWTARSLFAPQGTSTWNSQTTFVLPIVGSNDTTYMFMGDRWSFPLQASAAIYVWQPLMVSGTSVSMPEFRGAWKVNTSTGKIYAVLIPGKAILPANSKSFIDTGKWQKSSSGISSDDKDAALSVKFNGRQVGIYSRMSTNGGYAQVTIQNSKGNKIISAIVDMYCNYPISAMNFISPVLVKGNYTLTIKVMGEHSNWSDKRRSDYGSKGNGVAIEKVVVN